MDELTFEMYVKTITKLNYDEAYATAAVWYDVIETSYGAAERRRVGLAVWDLC